MLKTIDLCLQLDFKTQVLALPDAMDPDEYIIGWLLIFICTMALYTCAKTVGNKIIQKNAMQFLNGMFSFKD
jgi:hypothetical protein